MSSTPHGETDTGNEFQEVTQIRLYFSGEEEDAKIKVQEYIKRYK